MRGRGNRQSLPPNPGASVNMFERNRVDNTREQASVTATAKLIDGRTVSGRFFVSRSKTLFETMNDAGLFIEFETPEGSREMLSKSAIQSVRIIDVPRAPNLAPTTAQNFDPYGVLGVSSAASKSDIRAAFVERSKLYHPDRYANAELPQEVCAYLTTMARRVNAAYELIGAQETKISAPKAAQSAPVYERGQRV